MQQQNDEDKLSAISMHDFLDFLKLTCQVHQSITSKEGNLSSRIVLDYNKLAQNDLVNTLLCAKTNLMMSPKATDSDVKSNANGSVDACSITSGNRKAGANVQRRRPSQNLRKSRESGMDGVDSILTDKLSEVINEGILDSILPFICSSNLPQANKITHVCNNKAKQNIIAKEACTLKPQSSSTQELSPRNPKKADSGHNLTPNTSFSRSSRRKSSQSTSPLSEQEVVIHVCDEVKGTSRDFLCPQKLLVTKMGYFADVTAGQRLEDMDISVHCDIQIFEWLMRWVKRDTIAVELWPTLDPTNVVPILVSAGFLQMEPLLVDCLAYCHSYLNDVVKASVNLSCLNDIIISRLAAMYTNVELEMVKDKKERVTPRLWTKLIQSLCDCEPQALRGHYGSLADLIRCSRCQKYVNESVSSYIHCMPQHMHLNRHGQVVSHHCRDLTWNFNNFISALYKELKSWRRVYWRLWGNCHYLYCATCETHFPLYKMNWCLYHPDQPQYLGPVTEGRMAGPAGRYPCCGQMTFRYETLPGPSGCQYREHTVQIFNDRDRAILKLSQIAGDGGCLYEPPPVKVPVMNATNAYSPWWNELVLLPQRDRHGLLPAFTLDGIDVRYRSAKKLTNAPSTTVDSSSESESSDNAKLKCLSKQFSTTSSDGCESDASSPRLSKARHRFPRSRKLKPTGRYWSGEISARSNQDNQREFEERVMKQVIAMVSRRTGTDINGQSSNHQHGGSYVRLESEWRERHRHNKTKLTNNNINTNK